MGKGLPLYSLGSHSELLHLGIEIEILEKHRLAEERGRECKSITFFRKSD